jgi:hypothetical protein
VFVNFVTAPVIFAEKVHDIDRAKCPRYGIYDEKEEIQVFRRPPARRAGGGAVPECSAVCENSVAGRWFVSGDQC